MAKGKIYYHVNSALLDEIREILEFSYNHNPSEIMQARIDIALTALDGVNCNAPKDSACCIAEISRLFEFASFQWEKLRQLLGLCFPRPQRSMLDRITLAR